MKRAALTAAMLLVTGTAQAQFTFRPAGELATGSGRGRMDMTNYAPGMRFPLESGPAYANSQVWGRGGLNGGGGTQCDAQNYSYPWRDNYCESRTWTMPMCPASQGHQGQDIRPATCRNDVHWCVAAATGTVTNVGSYSVYITTDDGVRYDYLHMASVQVRVGQRVTREQRIGRVSNVFGTSSTTFHLHFNINRAVTGFGMVYAPTYGALVDAYQRLLNSGPTPDAGVPRDVVDVTVPRDVVNDVPRDVGNDVGNPRDVVDVVTGPDAVDVVAPADLPATEDVPPPRDVPRRDVVDATASPDASEPPLPAPGCGCAIVTTPRPGALALLAGLALLRRRRRR